MPKMKTNEQYIKEVYDLVKDEYVFLEKYIGQGTKIKVRHNSLKCNYHEYTTTPNNFLRGKRCPKCAGYMKKTHEEFIFIVESKYGLDMYEFLEEYIGFENKIKTKHLVCGFVWNPIARLFINKNTKPPCPNCNGGTKTLDTDSFKKKIYELVGNEYDVYGEYINAKAKVTVIHHTCGNKYPVSPECFLRGQRCPQCKSSKGERKVRDHLLSIKVNFKTQLEFADLLGIGGNPLRFDFAIFDSSNQLDCLIEYDGEFHFEKQYEGDSHDTLIEHDKRKNEYCKRNNIQLLRIPYWEYDNIEEILNNQIIKGGNNYELGKR